MREQATNLTIDFKDVCFSCKHRDIDVDEQQFFYNTGMAETHSKITCTHMKVCKLYLESDK